MMTPSKWDDLFYKLFREAIIRYHANGRYSEVFFTESEVLFLSSIGCRPKELFNLVAQYAQKGIPSPTTILLITAVRRDFFRIAREGKPSYVKDVTTHDLPHFGDEIKGIPYLPRILAKAKAKLEGNLGEDVVFGCEQDLAFLSEHGGMHPADFLMSVWRADHDDFLMAKWVAEQQSMSFPLSDAE